MTRGEFCERRGDFDIFELVDIARDYEVAGYDDFVSESDLDSDIFEDIRDAASNLYWYQIRDKLNDIESGYDFYVRGERLEYTPLSEESLYEDILYDMDNYELWDEPEEEDEEEEDDDSDSYDSLIPDEEELDEVQRELKAGVFSIDEFIESGADDMMVLRADADRIEEEQRAKAEAAESEPAPAEPVRKFHIGDPVKANELSNGRYSVTNELDGWRGVVTNVLPYGMIRVLGRRTCESRDMEWAVDESCFDLYHDETLDLPEEELFVF